MTKYFVTISKNSLWIREAEKVMDSTVKVVEIDKSLFDFLKSQLNFAPEYVYQGCYSWKDYEPRS